MSKKFSLNKQDFLKGLVLAVLISAITVIQESLNSGSLFLNWRTILIASLSGALAYLVKNFFTNDVTTIGNKEEEYTSEQLQVISECETILDAVNLELVGTRPKDR